MVRSKPANRPWTVARQTKYLVKFISSVGSNNRYDGAFIDFPDGSIGEIAKAEGVRFLALPGDEKYRIVEAFVLATTDSTTGLPLTVAKTPTAEMLKRMFHEPPRPTDLPLL